MRGPTQSKVSRRLLVFLLVAGLVTLGSGAFAAEVVFVDWSWDSAQIHNRIAGLIVEHGYGYDVDYLFADTVPGLQGMIRGDIHVSMEMWTDNFVELWIDATSKGQILDLGPNFPDAPQGWYVPTYVIEGDPARGIDPVAPDLRSVEDLPRYWELFRDPEAPSKGRFYNAPTGWVAHDINNDKLVGYELLDSYTSFVPGSQAALDASIVTAYRRGLPWVGYYWEPSGIMGIYDMTMLEEPGYTEECWESDRACAYPAVSVRVAVNADLPNWAPELVEFFTAYKTTLVETNSLLSYYENETRGDTLAAARWFLQNYEATWTQWVPAEVAARVKAEL